MNNLSRRQFLPLFGIPAVVSGLSLKNVYNTNSRSELIWSEYRLPFSTRNSTSNNADWERHLSIIGAESVGFQPKTNHTMAIGMARKEEKTFSLALDRLSSFVNEEKLAIKLAWISNLEKQDYKYLVTWDIESQPCWDPHYLKLAGGKQIWSCNDILSIITNKYCAKPLHYRDFVASIPIISAGKEFESELEAVEFSKYLIKEPHNTNTIKVFDLSGKNQPIALAIVDDAIQFKEYGYRAKELYIVD